jgi:hypothetical protein
MATIPSTQKFHTVAEDIPTKNKGSELANGYYAGYN